MRVADYISQRLQFLGLLDVYMVTGGAAMHLNDAFSITFKIKFIVYHEQSCAMAADSYARVQGIPAIVNVTAGPGAINAINGVFGAYVDSIPMILVSGQAKRETMVSSYSDARLRQLGDQEVDIIRMVDGICKYSKVVRNPLEIDKAVDEAYLHAISGRPGPSWLDIPIDVQAYPLPESFDSQVNAPLKLFNDGCLQEIPLASDDELTHLAQNF